MVDVRRTTNYGSSRRGY